MNVFSYYFNKIKTLPPKEIFTKSCSFFKRKFQSPKNMIFDHCLSTFSQKGGFRKINAIDLTFTQEQIKERRIIISLANLYCSHYFDLLGSGWTKNYIGLTARGLENHVYRMGVALDLGDRITKSNLPYAKKVASYIEPGYQAIDWQIDFKSGYRWSEKTWSGQIKYGHQVGADIKVPWELARMQHLPMLAWAYGIEHDKRYRKEFCNQVLDFIAANPPCFGANWCCTMDVGIRVANWLITYDLFRGMDADFSPGFEEIFAAAVYDHGLYIINHLEYSPQLRSNHYLSDIVGLLFVAIHLPCTPESNVWLGFAVQEVISEIKMEFNGDGSNFEASTNYHRLSTELMLYAAILSISLTDEKKAALADYDAGDHKVKPKLKPAEEQEYNLQSEQFFPAWFWERLEKAVEFTLHMTKPTGEIPQIGDNDSGRFFKLWPSYQVMSAHEAVETYENLSGYDELSPEDAYYDEKILDHHHILVVGSVLFGREDFLIHSSVKNLEAILIKELLQGRSVASYLTRSNLEQPASRSRWIKSEKNLLVWESSLNKQYNGKRIETCFEQVSLKDNLQAYAYPDFGLYLYQSKNLYLSLRCGSIGQNGNGGHAHNDQLSIELMLGQDEIFRDPGTYLYTPLPERRNAFRSTKAHATPHDKDQEQNEWISGARGLFSLLGDQAQGKCLYFHEDGVLASHGGFGKEIYRLIKIEEKRIVILDYGVEDRLEEHTAIQFSNGYGKLLLRSGSSNRFNSQEMKTDEKESVNGMLQLLEFAIPSRKSPYRQFVSPVGMGGGFCIRPHIPAAFIKRN